MRREREIRDEFVKSGHLQHYEFLRANKRGKQVNLLDSLKLLSEKKLQWDEVPHAHWETVHYLWHDMWGNKDFFQLARQLLGLGEESLLTQDKVFEGLIRISEVLRQMVRSVDTWTPCKGSAMVKFRHLVRHCFCTYSVPAFMEKIWLNGSDEDRKFFLEVADGKPVYGNWFLREAAMSRKIAHQFRNAPAHCTIVEAVRWAQVRVIRKDKLLFRAISKSFLGRSLKNDEFWLQVIHWMAREEKIDHRKVRLILRYIAYQKFGEFHVGKQIVPFPAPKPKFKIAGKHFSTLARLAEEFFEKLAVDFGWQVSEWTPMMLPNRDWEFTEADAPLKGKFKLIQLTTHEQLVKEGLRMDHCVATYLDNCQDGDCSIWSLRKVNGDEEKPLATIELENSKMTLEQVRAFKNRRPKEEEIELIREWAKEIEVEFPECALE